MDPALERNLRFYEQRRYLLAVIADGLFVLIHEERLIGIYPTEDEAMTSGYLRYGAGPFFVHRIAVDDPVVSM